MDEKFEQLAEDLIHDAEDIDCSLSEYRDGLKVMIDALRARHRQVCDELGE